ncbi:oligopeptide transport system permease protein [Paenibacillus algorifonticola]|uniref:Oligopeptide transport system permease protein n=1 Tax=Paenibacillus algorifonticola TaxID=684063 RepID=A0A1I2AB34_9BACL|nr:ABC transporter permease [Paenibacillus algorifonticola]SFE40999.1 oligopeptide transport system permease protein [Paenibacillus algorifonticola]
MRNYVLKRLGLAVVTLLVILLALFLMLELMPGSPFNDEKITQAQRAVLDAKYGLDQPVFNRFVHYIKAMLSGDFGVSYVIQKNMPISAMLEARLPVSIQIGFQAVLLGTAIGLLLGIVAALKHNSFADSLTTFISVIGVSFPSYVFALALSYFLGWKLKWFPLLYSSAAPFVSTVLPTIALSMFTIATVARFTRSEMIEVLSSEYIRLSESKGVGSARLIIVHALRNALIPIITVLAPLVVALMIGSLVIEQIFAIPGIGSLLVTAIQINDYNVIIAVSFLYSIMFIAIMLAVDILYGVIDPRIRLAKGEKHG